MTCYSWYLQVKSVDIALAFMNPPPNRSLFTPGTGRAEREDWGYRTWLKRLPRDSLVFYSDFDCTKVPNCVNVGGGNYYYNYHYYAVIIL